MGQEQGKKTYTSLAFPTDASLGQEPAGSGPLCPWPEGEGQGFRAQQRGWEEDR